MSWRVQKQLTLPNIKAKLDKLEALESENVILKDKLDRNDEVEKNDELDSHFSRKFTCKDFDEKFGSRRDLKHHKRSVHGEENDIQLLKMKFYEMSKPEITLHCKTFKIERK